LRKVSQKSQGESSALLNVSRESTQQARKVLDRGTAELAAAVDAGQVAVSAAAQLADKPAEVQRRVIEQVRSVGVKVDG
jgi:hypothetical protein